MQQTSDTEVVLKGTAPDSDIKRNWTIEIRFAIPSGPYTHLSYRCIVNQSYERRRHTWRPDPSAQYKWQGDYIPTGKWYNNRPKDVVKSTASAIDWILRGFK